MMRQSIRKPLYPKGGHKQSVCSRYMKPYYLVVLVVALIFLLTLGMCVIALPNAFSNANAKSPNFNVANSHPRKLGEDDVVVNNPLRKPPTTTKTQPRIFIGMPSLNDPDCAASIMHAFEMAEFPSRIFVGVYQQTDIPSYGDCLNISLLDCGNKGKKQHPLCSRMWQVRVNRVLPSAARGPTHGRVMSDKLYRDEEYYLITDSHTWFRPKWDSVLIDLHSSLPVSKYAIISHYPRGDETMNRALEEDAKAMRESGDLRGASYHICGSIFEASKNRMPRNANGCYTRVKKSVNWVLTPFWAGGFAFSLGKVFREVPLDPFTPWLFHGEEFHFATRAWTHGYDFYSPPFDVLFHRYADRAKRGRMPYSSEIGKLRDLSEKRVNLLWGLLDERTPEARNDEKVMDAVSRDIERYPLGNKRTMEQFWRFAGIEPISKNFTVFTTEQWQNGGLTRVPWNPPFQEPE